MSFCFSDEVAECFAGIRFHGVGLVRTFIYDRKVVSWQTLKKKIIIKLSPGTQRVLRPGVLVYGMR